MKKMNAGVWAGIVILLFSLLFLVLSFQFSYKSEVGPGPGFFPVWLTGILLVLSLIYIFQSVKKQSDDGEGEEWPKGQALKNILIILGCLFLFLILVGYLGFILSSVIFLFLLLYRAYKWYINLTIAVGVSVFLFWLFGQVLGVALPVNGLGI